MPCEQLELMFHVSELVLYTGCVHWRTINLLITEFLYSYLLFKSVGLNIILPGITRFPYICDELGALSLSDGYKQTKTC
jgi:hypothetical protein